MNKKLNGLLVNNIMTVIPVYNLQDIKMEPSIKKILGLGSIKTAVLVTTVLITVSGCSTNSSGSWGVDPWDRDLLAKPEMAINSSPLDQSIDDHIYFSKEASSGGRSFAGGGCGCN